MKKVLIILSILFPYFLFSQCISGNCFNGKGVYVYNNARYEGYFNEGYISGRGKMFYNDGEKYIGNYKDGEVYGKGTYYYTDGTKQEGIWYYDEDWSSISCLYDFSYVKLSGDYENGFGKIENKRDSIFYEGYFKNYRKDSIGTETGEYQGNKGVYEGNYKDGWRKGFGVYTFNNSEAPVKRIEGLWESGDCVNGTIYYANGDVYTGNIYLMDPNKNGVMIYSNGDKYDGKWDYDFVEGKITYDNGDVFEGSFDDYYGVIDRGVYSYSNGDKFDGRFDHDGLKERGVYSYSNGDTFEGVFEKDSISYGTMTYLNGNKYKGKWFNDKIDGNCNITYSNGDRYNGGCKRSLREGQGTMYLDNGDNFKTSWINDMRNDTLIYYEEVDTLESSLISKYIYKEDELLSIIPNCNYGNCISGKGIYTYKSGDIYIGDRLNNQKAGFGKYIWSNSNFYMGYWEDDLKHGDGTMVFFDGVKCKGKWKKGLFKSGKCFDENGKKIRIKKVNFD